MRGGSVSLIFVLLAIVVGASAVTVDEPVSVPGPPAPLGSPGDIYGIPSIIESLDLPRGTERSLLAKVESAIRAYEMGWPDDLDVVDHLYALLNQVDALAGKQIPAADAALLRDAIALLIVELGTPIITCVIEEREFPATIEECREIGGAVQECVPLLKDQGKGEGAKGAGSAVVLNYTETDVVGPMSGWATNLSNAVRASGVTNKTYVSGSYTCVNFAQDLQNYLNGLGYSTSFTVVYKKDARGNIESGHAIVDVKAPDGTVLFVDPQNDETPNLDLDHDGVIEYATSHPTGSKTTWPMTEGDRGRIEVYASRAAAKAAGLPV